MSVFTYRKIYEAYRDCSRRKKSTVNAIKFEINRERNLLRLLYELRSGVYEISRHMCFIITIPSPREIFAADFRDRVVHHLLYNEIKDLFETDFIDTSYANRIGKGTHNAVKKLKWYVSRGGVDGRRLYGLKLDVRNFFRSIDKKVLWSVIHSKILSSQRDRQWKDEVVWLAKKIIFHDPSSNYIFKGDPLSRKSIKAGKSLITGPRSTGLPIGNLTSQFFANIYLNELDHYITGDLSCGGLGYIRYVRYVDDFVIIDEERDKLAACIKTIDGFLWSRLKLQLHPSKIYLQSTSHGIDFLGYYIKPTHTLVRRSVMARFRRKILDNTDVDTGLLNVHHIPMINSYLGHFSHADSHNLVNSLGS